MSALPARNDSPRAARKRAASSGKASRSENRIIDAHPSEHIGPEQRRKMVAEAAYFYAEHRGFEPGHELDDWLAAEDQVTATLSLMDLEANALLKSLER
jgi:hypothetical protein